MNLLCQLWSTWIQHLLLARPNRKRKMALLMTQIMVGGSQGPYLVLDSLTGVSSKGRAIPSSALELRHLKTSVNPEAKSCLLAGLAAPQPFAGLEGSSSPAGSPISWWRKPRCLKVLPQPGPPLSSAQHQVLQQSSLHLLHLQDSEHRLGPQHLSRCHFFSVPHAFQSWY